MGDRSFHGQRASAWRYRREHPSFRCEPGARASSRPTGRLGRTSRRSAPSGESGEAGSGYLQQSVAESRRRQPVGVRHDPHGHDRHPMDLQARPTGRARVRQDPLVSGRSGLSASGDPAPPQGSGTSAAGSGGLRCGSSGSERGGFGMASTCTADGPPRSSLDRRSCSTRLTQPAVHATSGAPAASARGRRPAARREHRGRSDVPSHGVNSHPWSQRCRKPGTRRTSPSDGGMLGGDPPP